MTLRDRYPDVQRVLDVLGRRTFLLDQAAGSRIAFADVDLRSAFLYQAELGGAVFSDVHLEGSFLKEANLQGAKLDGTILTAVILKAADLRGADLSGAQDLSRADLTGAIADAETTWPTGFDWRKAGVRR